MDKQPQASRTIDVNVCNSAKEAKVLINICANRLLHFVDHTDLKDNIDITIDTITKLAEKMRELGHARVKKLDSSETKASSSEKAPLTDELTESRQYIDRIIKKHATKTRSLNKKLNVKTTLAPNQCSGIQVVPQQLNPHSSWFNQSRYMYPASTPYHTYQAMPPNVIEVTNPTKSTERKAKKPGKYVKKVADSKKGTNVEKPVEKVTDTEQAEVTEKSVDPIVSEDDDNSESE